MQDAIGNGGCWCLFFEAGEALNFRERAKSRIVSVDALCMAKESGPREARD